MFQHRHISKSVSHDYLVLCIRTRSDQVRFGNRIWARCERNPGSIEGGPLRLSVMPAPAMDTIKFSFERSRLKGENDVAIMELAFDSLQVIHVAELLHIIHIVSPDYRLGSHNCWWFAAVAIGSLQVFGNDWTIQPSRDWIKSAVKVLGRNTEESTQRVLSLFVEKWNIASVVDITPLTDDRTWLENRSRRRQV
ncbi:uncharacterized protein EI90DRAFT_2031274 [Cantharellus anzutake]|uniref:uncharacterized protein n=1 Tax=Cantharellus anzutake TaxID=1750568 RepID=UPI0019033757|nr:uncharacterized protein EI90DRAFT_2031274 [Cantharellus anzutake]KAF8325885.1 hypothetical protein EI90DRAFT_2031274 [Cantharellus anzutake]